MTDPISSTASSSPLTSAGDGEAAPKPAPNPVMVDVSRSEAAPIYVYRVTDTATGRTLVEIPNHKPLVDPKHPGATFDAKV